MSIVPSPSAGIDGPSGGQISDVVGMILDKGLVIDVFVRVSLVGIEILTVDARVVVASVDTYLRFAEKAGRLNIEEATRKPGLPEVLGGVTGGLTGLIHGPPKAPAVGAATAAPPAQLERGGNGPAPIRLAERRAEEERS